MRADNNRYAPLAIYKRAEKRRRLLRFTFLTAAFSALTAAVLIALPVV